MKIVLLDAATLGSDIDLTPLQGCGTLTVYDMTPAELLPGRIADAEILVTNKCPLRAETLQAAKKLRMIAITATGCDIIDSDYCRAHGISLANIPGYSTDSVAQLTLAMALNLCCHLGEYREYVHSGSYTRSGIPNRLTPVWHELRGKTWGIIGCGAIGHQVGRVAQALGCRVLAFRRGQDPEFETADLQTVLRESDLISIHLPLTDATRGLISREMIGLLKPGAIVINAARGAVTDEAALADALLAGRLGGLGIDVYSREPFPTEHPFTKLVNYPNVILTPHTGWGSLEARNRSIQMAAENIFAFLSGEEKHRIC